MADGTYIILIRTSNAAFVPQPGAEVARILRNLAHQCEQHGAPQRLKLRDTNGSTVGHAAFQRDG